MNKIVVHEQVWNRMRAHLLSDNSEHLAFFFVNSVRQSNGVTFIVKDVRLISDDDLEDNSFSIKLKLDAILSVTNEAKKRGMSLIEAHSHPFSTANVNFSRTDMDGFKEFVPYILDSLGGRPYGALVLGQSSVSGLCWQTKQGKTIDKIVIHGDSLTLIASATSQKFTKNNQEYYSKFDRQILAFGPDGQIKTRLLKVAIVGLGGIGSHIVQQLLYIGVRDFVIVDFDKASKDNLNRLIGANIDSVAKPKHEAMTNMIKFVCKGEEVTVKVVEKETQDKEAIAALKESDIIFGCVDNDGARTVLNEISKAYMIPLLDCATGIHTTDDGVISEIGGRIVFVRPTKPCLRCVNEINVDEATYYLQTEKEQDASRREGYVEGFDVPSPSVVSLNGLIASAAVTEFLAYVAGFRMPKSYLMYDVMEQRLREIVVSSDPDCHICNGMEGEGGKADIENRYAKRNFSMLGGDPP